jgi:hypothetical protein
MENSSKGADFRTLPTRARSPCARLRRAGYRQRCCVPLCARWRRLGTGLLSELGPFFTFTPIGHEFIDPPRRID